MSLETDLLQQWPVEGLPVLWKSSQVGGGYASVVVSKGMLFTIGQQGQDVLAVALDAVTGKRCTFAAFPWRWTEGEGSGVRVVAILDREGSYRIGEDEAAGEKQASDVNGE
jgi:hypothetical protein